MVKNKIDNKFFIVLKWFIPNKKNPSKIFIFKVVLSDKEG